MHRVFVYGSLKRDFHNHQYIHHCECLGETKTANAVFRMVSLGAFPGVLTGGSSRIVGEVYFVDDQTLELLDTIESNGRFYQRILVDLECHDSAWMYVLLQPQMSCADIDGDVHVWTHKLVDSV